jgi:hypothetical protein
MAGMKVTYGLALSEARYKRFIRPLPTGTGRSMVTRVTGSTSDMNKDPGHSLVNRESEERWTLTEGRSEMTVAELRKDLSKHRNTSELIAYIRKLKADRELSIVESSINEGSVLPKGMRGRPSDKWRRSNPKGSQRFSGKGSIETVKSITR